MTVALWVVQCLLAALFLFAGVMKLLMPSDALAKETALPGALMHFVSVAEVLGGLGLVLPGLFRIRPRLTPLAAIGLFLIMIGATVMTIRTMGLVTALVPSVTGLLLLFVAYGRWRLAPHRGSSDPSALRAPR